MSKRTTSNRVIPKRNVWIGKTQTSVTLEGIFWTALKEIAGRRHLTVHQLAEQIAESPQNQGNLSSAIREFVLGEQLR